MEKLEKVIIGTKEYAVAWTKEELSKRHAYLKEWYEIPERSDGKTRTIFAAENVIWRTRLIYGDDYSYIIPCVDGDLTKKAEITELSSKIDPKNKASIDNLNQAISDYKKSKANLPRHAYLIYTTYETYE